MEKNFRIFIGYDPREKVAFHVLSYSIIKYSSIPVNITPVNLFNLRINTKCTTIETNRNK